MIRIKQFLNNSCRVEFDKFFPYTPKDELDNTQEIIAKSIEGYAELEKALPNCFLPLKPSLATLLWVFSDGLVECITNYCEVNDTIPPIDKTIQEIVHLAANKVLEVDKLDIFNYQEGVYLAMYCVAMLEESAGDDFDLAADRAVLATSMNIIAKVAASLLKAKLPKLNTVVGDTVYIQKSINSNGKDLCCVTGYHEGSLHKNNVRETMWQIFCLELLPPIPYYVEDYDFDGLAVKPTIYVI